MAKQKITIQNLTNQEKAIKSTIRGIEKKLTNRLERLARAKRIEASKLSDWRFTKKRLTSKLQDDIAQDKSELGRLAKEPDEIYIEIIAKREEIKQLNQEVSQYKSDLSSEKQSLALVLKQKAKIIKKQKKAEVKAKKKGGK